VGVASARGAFCWPRPSRLVRPRPCCSPAPAGLGMWEVKEQNIAICCVLSSKAGSLFLPRALRLATRRWRRRVHRQEIGHAYMYLFHLNPLHFSVVFMRQTEKRWGCFPGLRGAAFGAWCSSRASRHSALRAPSHPALRAARAPRSSAKQAFFYRLSLSIGKKQDTIATLSPAHLLRLKQSVNQSVSQSVSQQ